MPRDKTATNAKIIQYMKEEFLTFGYEQASLNRVSAKVGITTAGLYKSACENSAYFSPKIPYVLVHRATVFLGLTHPVPHVKTSPRNGM